MTLIGNLVRDPELQTIASGIQVCRITIATNHKIKDKEESMFIDVTLWDKQAAFVHAYFKKGKPILVEGRLKLDTWTHKETGKQQSKHTIVAESVSFLPSDNTKSILDDKISESEVKINQIRGSQRQPGVMENNAANEFKASPQKTIDGNIMDNDELPF